VTAARALVSAPKAAFVVVDDGTSTSFVSPSDGKLVRTLPPAPKPLERRAFSPDASAWFDADRDGKLVRVAIE
jgi:hypothetical protein